MTALSTVQMVQELAAAVAELSKRPELQAKMARQISAAWKGLRPALTTPQTKWTKSEARHRVLRVLQRQGIHYAGLLLDLERMKDGAAHRGRMLRLVTNLAEKEIAAILSDERAPAPSKGRSPDRQLLQRCIEAWQPERVLKRKGRTQGGAPALVKVTHKLLLQLGLVAPMDWKGKADPEAATKKAMRGLELRMAPTEKEEAAMVEEVAEALRDLARGK